MNEIDQKQLNQYLLKRIRELEVRQTKTEKYIKQIINTLTMEA